jgi:hypothetical protein
MDINDDQIVVERTIPWYMDADTITLRLMSISDPVLKSYASSFLRDGYVVIPNSVGPTVCDEVLAEFREVEARNPDLFSPHLDTDGHYPRMINMHLAVPGLRRLFHENPITLALQDLLFESETVLYTSLFYERGSGQEIHRDTPYFCTRPEYRYFGMWVALEDVDETNGPLMALVKGHLMPELDRESIATELFGSPDNAPATSDDSWNVYQTRVSDDARAAGLQLVTIPVSKGSTVLWHPQLPHGGSPITDLSRTRFSLVMHTTPENTPVYHQDAFFNPSKPLPTTANWAYLEDGARRFAKHGTVSFNHQTEHAVKDFK